MKTEKKIKNQKGSALAYMLVILFITTTILVSMLGYISSQITFSLNRVQKEEAFQVAEVGAFYYRWYLAHHTAGKTAQQINDFWQNGSPLGVGSSAVVDYEGIGKYKLEVTRPDPGSTIVNVKSTGWTYRNPSMQRIVSVRFRRASWSEYMFLSNSYMNFGTQAEVWGKVHSNYGIRFDGIAHNTVSALPPTFTDPDLHKKKFGVYTTSGVDDPTPPAYPWPDGTVPSRPDVFMGGRQFPVSHVSFSGVTTDLANMKTQAQDEGGYYFDSSGLGRRIILKADGTFDMCTVDRISNNNTLKIKYYKTVSGSGTCDTCSGPCVTNYAIPNDKIIFIENNAWVDGSVDNKRVTVVAANLTGEKQADIYIGASGSDMTYSAFNCQNSIGLIAQRDIRILDTCPINYVVDAALLAQTGVVGINDKGSFGAKNSMTFNGAIASYLQPYFMSGLSGFAVRFYYYDSNLLYCPPPYFPTGTNYSIDLWQEL